MTAFTESTVESAALAWLESLGWQTAFGPDIAPDGARPERERYADVVLKGRFRAAVERINPGMPTVAIEEAVRKVCTPESPSVIENNRRFHQMLTDGVDVSWMGAQGERLFLCQILDVAVTQRPTDAGVESDRHSGALLTDTAPTVKDRRFHQHLKGVIEHDKRATNSALVMGPVEQFDGENQRVDRLLKKHLCFALHAPTLSKNRSASFTRSSPEISLGNSASRRAARVRDCLCNASCFIRS